jgi:hypothetical protein
MRIDTIQINIKLLCIYKEVFYWFTYIYYKTVDVRLLKATKFVMSGKIWEARVIFISLFIFFFYFLRQYVYITFTALLDGYFDM